MSLKNIIGVEEAAKILALSPGYIKNLCANGKLPSKKIGKTWVLDKTKMEVVKMKKEFGAVTFDGKEYTLTQNAWLTHTQGLDGIADNHYLANAINQDGNEYNVYWNPVEGWERMEDESDCCDWTNPVHVSKL
jgi:excisionase family DNA binding protein